MGISGACDVASMSTHRYTTPRRAGVLAALLAAVVQRLERVRRRVAERLSVA
jgi:hypothetical protein